MAVRNNNWYTCSNRVKIPEREQIGCNPAWWAHHQSLAHENSDASSYLIANEWICGNIAQFLRLPIPPFALMRSGKNNKMFASLRFVQNDMAPPDANGAACVKADSDICTGIVLFDALVINTDRHHRNVAVDDPLKPRSIYIFDHDHALFGHRKRHGIKRLRANAGKLTFTGRYNSSSHTHCLASHLDTATFMDIWYQRIAQIPDWFIEEICHKEIGITSEESREAVEFLTRRKYDLPAIIKGNRRRFPKIKDWGLF